ncbi:PfkB family carbohydrate kinase [Micromonospora sp. WMMD1120]|uniref:PfkB family carbohydrate kinase n=1 Tax=Micromonospora sp. WMMD1120 TaxID=3016106 RepID=UPI002417FC1D|nr:PfkB family carbohydrate kinase [Micromonospora sp. WMMD1120]MDG4811298.1 PfkB family carbohydrate kinase [Micromonospora sp. WMMD1120]
MGYAVVLGEALVDLLDSDLDGERVYRQAIGGGPLNVAVGVARLGGAAQFVGSLGDDVLGGRIRAFLGAADVGVSGAVTVPAPTTLAVVTYDGPEPDFRFYGEPASYGLLGPDDLDLALLEGADVLSCGSITLLEPAGLAAARRAWSLATGLRVLDPNVRPRLLDGPAAVEELRAVVAEFAAGAHLVKLSAADAMVLYPGEPVEGVAAYLREVGAATVVLTLGAAGAVLAAADADPVRVPAPPVNAVDATGAGDSVLAALIADLLLGGEPDSPQGWVDRVAFALRVAGLVCESPGGATAMPTRADVERRFPS